MQVLLEDAGRLQAGGAGLRVLYLCVQSYTRTTFDGLLSVMPNKDAQLGQPQRLITYGQSLERSIWFQ